MAETIQGPQGSETDLEAWEVPQIKWVNGVPGCGKSTWVVAHFNEKDDIIATTTTEAAKDLREKLEKRMGPTANKRVRTIASILVNGSEEHCKRLMIDEALMHHFGSLVMVTRLTGAQEVILIGDVNQLPYIDRENLFEIEYFRPNAVANITQELLCTYRNPLDVAYALSDVYDGIYSARPQTHSLRLMSYSGSIIPPKNPKTLYLVHTQADKEAFSNEGYGEESRILTVHEAQGLTYEHVIIIRSKRERGMLQDSVQDAVVAVSRHTVDCVYYTDDGGDATGRFINKAMAARSHVIIEYNLKMAMHHRNAAVVDMLEGKLQNETN